MYIERFSDDHPDHLEVLVRDGARQALVVMEKRSNRVLQCEAVGSADRAGDHSFAEEASAWLTARVRPKYLGRASAAA